MTLSQAATITRRAILSSVILLALGLAVWIGYSIWHANYLASLPKPEEKPDTKFGILPLPNFSTAKVSSSNFSYQLATETGSFPNFGKLAKVYFIPKATASFLAEDKAKDLAKKFNIDAQPEASEEGKYLFKKDKQILNLDIDTGNFTYQLESSSSSKPLQLPDEVVIQNFRSFLASLGVFRDELKSSPAKVSNHSVLVWPADLDKTPIVTASFKTPLVRAQVQKDGHSADDYISLNFSFWPIDKTTFSTYPIKTATQALEDLKSGKGIVVVEPTKPQVSITSSYLAYFESEDYSPYLQPIFVFEGPNFVAYVPAITDQYINSAR